MTPTELSRAFISLITNNGSRFERAAASREAMKAKQEAGEPLNDYRSLWIKEASLALIDTLRDQAQKFNDKYQGDVATADDLLAITLTTANLILGQGGKKLKSIEVEDDPDAT
jgi:hypothetical protein